MAKESGLGMTVAVDDSSAAARSIENDITSLTFGTPSAVQDVTGVDSSSHERILLLADMTVALAGVFNDAATLSHAVFKDYRTLSGAEVGRTTTIVHSGQTLADEILYRTYDLNRAADGSLTWSAPGDLSDGGTVAWA